MNPRVLFVLAAAALGGVLVWKFLARTKEGHASPEDAIAAGWMVRPAGITGWQEESPDGQKSYLHETGWSGDPFTKS
jgi:hypothetical protein